MAATQTLKVSIRGLRQSPLFVIAAAATLALGIGANVTVFAVINALLWRPLPYDSPERLVAVVLPTRVGAQVPSPQYLAWTASTRRFQSIGAYNAAEVTLLLRDGEQSRINAVWITPHFLAVLGARPVIAGRAFSSDDGRVGSERVAIISYAFWRRVFGKDPAVLGASLKIQGLQYTVVGITAENFLFPNTQRPEVLLPMVLPPPPGVVRFMTGVVGRLEPTSSISDAERELAAIDQRARSDYPNAVRSVVTPTTVPRLIPLQMYLLGDMAAVLRITFVAVLVVLFLACVNVGSLSLARTMSRRRELAIRTALGAGRWSLVRLLLIDNLVVALLGGALGFGLAGLLMDRLRSELVNASPYAGQVSGDWRTAVFAALMVLATAALCSVGPAATALGIRVQMHLTDSVSLLIRQPRLGARRLFIVLQVALAVVLLMSGVLLTRTLWELTGQRLGFNPTNVVTFRVSASGIGQNQGLGIQRLLERLKNIPNLIAAGASTSFPMSGHGFLFTIAIKGAPPPSPDAAQTPVDVVSPDYFRAIGAALRDGRLFDDRDDASGNPVAVVNASFVRSAAVEGNILGRRIALGGTPDDADIEIIGVVNDIRDGNPGHPTQPTVYRPFSQAAPQIGWHTANVAMLMSRESESLGSDVRQIVKTIAPGSAVYDIVPLPDRIAGAVAPERQRALLFNILAAISLALAIVGIYGFVGYTVSQRMHEYAVRLALGSSGPAILWAILRRAVLPAAIGVASGLAAAPIVARVFTRFVYGVNANDPHTLGLIAVAMMGVAMASAILPAWRALSADPSKLLRGD